jgi:mRNA interferase MazF
VVIRQGDVYWVDLGPRDGSGPAFRHPHVVLQNDLFNSSGIGTVVVCAITSKMQRAAAPGNVALESGEANLPRQSVVNITQIFTVDKDELTERIGSLEPFRLRQILAGLDLLLTPHELPPAGEVNEVSRR